MNIGLVIIYGALIGFLASKLKNFNSGFGMWWDIILGITGSTFASSIIVFCFLINTFPKNYTINLHLYGIVVEIAGALALLYVARYYNKIFHLANEY